ncbi:MAG: YecA family protein [Mucilaginibacter sp.]
MKVGRNDPCPCGSGEKYKKCCLNKDAAIPHAEAAPKPEKTYPLLSANNTNDLLKTFAGLSVLPQNHGKYFRLEQLILHSILQANANQATPERTALKAFLDADFESHYMEDICVNTFTDLNTFFGGDYLTFPGITENGQEILTNLFAAIFHWPDSGIPSWFKSNVKHASFLILGLSDSIAKRLNYTRYQEGEATESALFVPDEDSLEAVKNAVTFTNEEVEALLREYGIAGEALEAFVIDPKEITSRTLYLERNPVLYRPILKTEEGYIVLSPASLCLALTDFIWSMASEHRCMPAVNGAYHAIVWNNLQLQLSQLRFKSRSVDGFTLHETIKDGLYQFDADKLAYIYYHSDDGSGYHEHGKRFGMPSFSAGQGRMKEAMAAIKAHTVYKDFKVFSITFLSSIGRDLMFPLMQNEADRVLAMPVYEFDVLWQLKDTDAIDLWKYAIARDQMLDKLKGFHTSLSFIDQFKLFREKSDSFYLSDDAKIVIPNILPGYAVDWLLKAKLASDKHSVKVYQAGKPAIVPVERKESYAPTYLNLMELADGYLHFEVEGFSQPIWIEPVNMPEPRSSELHDIYWQLADAIAYWLWQVQEPLQAALESLGVEPLNIRFDLNPVDKFDQIERDFTRKENLASFFGIVAAKDGFNITIPAELIPYLYGADNEGERVLVRKLLEGFNQVLALNGKAQLSDGAINAIIEGNAPLGMKKKFFILDTSDNLLLDPRNLKGYRYVQEYDVSKVTDEIVPLLGADCPPEGEIKTKKERNDLAYKIAGDVLFKHLQNKLSQYNSTDLLKRLIGLNESLIRKREELRIHTPTRIACFVSEEQQQDDLKENLDKVNRTTIAIRCLIEQIAAEPTTGSQPISKTAVDELVAIMDQIIAWGSTSDHIHFDLFDIKIGVLPSGRIGTQKTIFNEVFDPYYRSKSAENVTDAVSTFEQVFPQNDPKVGKKIPHKLDEAFKTDYGVSMNRICDFIDGLVQIGLLQTTDYASFPLNQLRDEVNKYVKPAFEQAEFESVMSYLSLEDRGRIIDIDKAKGYEFIDIMPWRFNRMLSLMRKPLVITGKIKDTDRMVYWGARQVLASRIYLAEQCLSDRLRVLKSSTAIKSALGEFAKLRGDHLVATIVASIDPSGLIIDQERFIGPQYEFKHMEDIGDIDVLIIDVAEKTIYSLESKSMSPSRNIKEMVEEMGKLFGSASEKGWIDKHMERHRWIENNFSQLEAKYGVNLSGFKVKSFFVTEEDMLTPYLRKMDLPLPFITKYDLEEKGYNALK